MLVDITQLTSPTWLGFQYLQNSSKDMPQNINHSPWGGTKSPWLRWLNYYYFSCLTVFLSFCIFSLLWLYSFFGTQKRSRRLKFFYKQEAGRRHGGGWCLFLGRAHRVLLSYSHTPLVLVQQSPLCYNKVTWWKELSGVCLIKILISFMRAPPSWPNHLPKTPTS